MLFPQKPTDGSRINATNATVFTLDGTSYLGDLINCTITVENTTENVKCASDAWDIAALAAHHFTISAQGFANAGTPSFLTLATSGTATAVVNFGFSASGTVTGTVLFVSVGLQYERDTYTKCQIEGTGRGELSVLLE